MEIMVLERDESIPPKYFSPALFKLCFQCTHEFSLSALLSFDVVLSLTIYPTSFLGLVK